MASLDPTFGVSSAKAADLRRRLKVLGVRQSDLVEKFIRARGPGGQKVNKSSAAVYLKHIPSGLEIKTQRFRSQALNRFEARRLLVDRLEEEREGKRSAQRARIEKIRRQKRKRSKRAKEKMLEAKHHQADKKRQRRKPEPE